MSVERRPPVLQKSTAEQRLADEHVAKTWKRKLGSEFNPATIHTAEETRRRLLAYARWLRGQAEALRNPVTRWRTLVEDPPKIDVIDEIMNAEDFGRAGRRIQRNDRRSK